MTTLLINNGLVAAFTSNNLSTSCVLPIQNSSRNLRTMMTEQSAKVDNMIDVVYEEETDDEANF